LPRLAVRPVHLRPHAGGGRRQLATADVDEPACRHRARPDGQGPVRAGFVRRPDVADTITLTVDGPIATITNNNPDKHNAFDDEMDAARADTLGRLKERPDGRANHWGGVSKVRAAGE